MSDLAPASDPAPPVPVSGACHNCGTVLHGRFCAQCGQEALPLNPRLRDVVREVAHTLLDYDGRLFQSVRRLFLSPGFLTREHFAGRRVSWLPPLRLYLLFSVAYFAVASLAGLGARVEMRVTSDAEAVEDLKKLCYESEAELQAAVDEARARWMPRVMFVLVPVFAGLVQLMTRRMKRAYPQHVFFALHVHAVWFGAAALVAALQWAGGPLMPRDGALDNTAGALILLYIIVYITVAFRRAYDVTTRRALLNTAVVLILYGIAVAAATVAIIWPTVFNRQC
jgi:hypothetical protein